MNAMGTYRKTLSELFAQPLHVRPLVQCVCGVVLRDALCEDLYCARQHTPPELWQMCGACQGRKGQGGNFPRREEGA